MRQWILILIFCGSGYGLAQTVGKIESFSLFEKDFVIMGQDRKGPYLLPDSLIIENSEQVFIDGNQLSESEYNLNAIDGEIRFRQVVPSQAKIRILYKIFPYKLKKNYYHRKLFKRVFGAPTGTAELPAIEAETPEENYASRLNKSGSITRGITVGNNRGLKKNSALKINISGEIARDVNVTAALTDQSTPIQPEGTTQNLQEIDKVFVRIKSPHLSATMGDYNVELQASRFAQYNRKLQGAMGQVDYGNTKALASVAVSRGKYRSQSIQGREGYQGPYQLKGDQGQIDIIILAGTERVYIDGEAMVRGESNDYVIDYAAGQLTFTRRRLITSDSRIVVDFQYSDENFRRHLYTFHSRTSFWHDRIKFGSSFIREVDDKENPLDFVLTDDKRRILQNAGDNPDEAVQDGATFVGEGNGRYSLTEDSVFVHVGQDSGDYNVIFSDVGSGNGAYQYKGGGVYEYIGDHSGRYAPVQLLATPQNQYLLDFDLEFNPHPAISLQSEIALSSLDRNIYSSIDDNDNDGVAQNWQLTIQNDSLRLLEKHLGSIDLSAKWRKINNRFRDIDRTTEIEYNRKWDLNESFQRQEDIQEINIKYLPRSFMQISGEYGNIKKGDYFASTRSQLSSWFEKKGWPSYQYRIESISKNDDMNKVDGKWWRQRGNTQVQLWHFKPFANYEGEVKKENWSDSLYTGFKFDEVDAGIEFTTGGRFSATAEMTYRDDRDYTSMDQFTKKSTASTQSLRMQWHRIGSFSGTMAFTHRRRSYTDPQQSSVRTDLAEITTRYTPWKNALNAQLNYQISNTATARKERIYIKVSEGDGNYRFDEDLNEYVNDPLGDYIMRVLTTDQFIPVIELKTSARIRLEPTRFFSRLQRNPEQRWWKKAIKVFSSESFISLEERTQDEDVWDIYLLDLKKFQHPTNTIVGNINFRQDLYLFEHSRDFSLRYRFRQRDEKNNQYLEGGQDRSERENSIRLISRLTSSLNSKVELMRERTLRRFFYAGRQDRDIYTSQADVDLSYRPDQRFEIALQFRASDEQDRAYIEPTTVQAFSIIPRITYSLRGRGRVRGNVEWSRVNATPEDRPIPYEMANGRSMGQSLRWDLRFDYRISDTIQATLSYYGRNEPERDRVIHTGRAQVTAAFR